MRAILSVRPKCSRKRVSLKEEYQPSKPLSERTGLNISRLNCSGAFPKYTKVILNCGPARVHQNLSNFAIVHVLETNSSNRRQKSYLSFGAQHKGAWQKSDEQSDRSVRQSDPNKVIEHLVLTSLCGTLSDDRQATCGHKEADNGRAFRQHVRGNSAKAEC